MFGQEDQEPTQPPVDGEQPPMTPPMPNQGGEGDAPVENPGAPQVPQEGGDDTKEQL